MEAESGRIVLGFSLVTTGLASAVAGLLQGRKRPVPEERRWLLGAGTFFIVWGLLLLLGVL